ncbi:hypothetical protein ACHAXA_011697, partial [Cyclostephanos tholiformis]
NDTFGHFVDITAEGNAIICSSLAYHVNGPGYVDFGANIWEQIGQNITGKVSGDWFGMSVSITDDGEMIVVGAFLNNGLNGEGSGSAQVRIYHLDDNGMNWEQIGNNFDGNMAGDGLGFSVSLSANGTTVAIRAPGAAIIEIRTGQLGKNVYDDYDKDYFGHFVDTSSEGITIAIGLPGIPGIPGYVEVFSLDVGDNLGHGNWKWKKIGQDISGEMIGDGLSFSVSISDNG